MPRPARGRRANLQSETRRLAADPPGHATPAQAGSRRLQLLHHENQRRRLSLEPDPLAKRGTERPERDSAQLAGIYAFFAGFVEECVDFGLEIFLLVLQSAHLHFDGLALVTLVELDAAGSS